MLYVVYKERAWEALVAPLVDSILYHVSVLIHAMDDFWLIKTASSDYAWVTGVVSAPKRINAAVMFVDQLERFYIKNLEFTDAMVENLQSFGK